MTMTDSHHRAGAQAEVQCPNPVLSQKDETRHQSQTDRWIRLLTETQANKETLPIGAESQAEDLPPDLLQARQCFATTSS